MFRRFILSLVVAASVLVISCSDSESTKPAPNDSQAIQGEMDAVMTDVMTAPGSSALMNNMQVMDYLPFTFPAVPLKSIGAGLGDTGYSESKFLGEVFTKLFPSQNDATKQDDHFIFSNWLGTYTFNDYIYDDYDNIVDANWTIVEGGSNVTIIVPGAYTSDGKEFKMVIYNYTDEYIMWYYEDDPGYPYDDYFPTLMDMEVFSAGTKVLDLDFTGDWQYMAAMDDVMPVELSMTLTMTPFTFTVTYTNSTPNILNYAVSLKENNVTRMSFDAILTFTDGTLEDISEVDLDYMFGIYLISFWTDVIATENLTESATLTMDEIVAELNTEEYMYCHIFENDVQIGRLKAKKVWDEYEWNEETQSEGNWVIAPYIEFNDGSTLDEEVLAGMLGDSGLGK